MTTTTTTSMRELWVAGGGMGWMNKRGVDDKRQRGEEKWREDGSAAGWLSARGGGPVRVKSMYKLGKAANVGQNRPS